MTYNYRRITIGWKEYSKTDFHYKEGKDTLTFNYKGHNIVIALCGDLWVCPEKFKNSGLLLWPVYVNFTVEEWKTEEVEYAKQALLSCDNVLMVNSLSENPDSFGGCFYFRDGQIKEKLNYKIEGILTVEI